jgi:hypothetical protein
VIHSGRLNARFGCVSIDMPIVPSCTHQFRNEGEFYLRITLAPPSTGERCDSLGSISHNAAAVQKRCAGMTFGKGYEENPSSPHFGKCSRVEQTDEEVTLLAFVAQ